MQQAPRLLIPALGAIYRTFAPVTEPLIRVVAGGSLAIHGYPILFGNIGAAAKFLESTGFQNGLFWAYVVGVVEFVCGLCLALGFLTRLVAAPIIGFLVIAIVTYHWQFGFRMGEPRDRISAVLVDRGIAFPGARWRPMVARCADWPGAVMA